MPSKICFGVFFFDGQILLLKVENCFLSCHKSSSDDFPSSTLAPCRVVTVGDPDHQVKVGGGGGRGQTPRPLPLDLAMES